MHPSKFKVKEPSRREQELIDAKKLLTERKAYWDSLLNKADIANAVHHQDTIVHGSQESLTVGGTQGELNQSLVHGLTAEREARQVGLRSRDTTEEVS